MILKILKTFLIIVLSGIIAITVWEYWETTHRIHFKIKDKYSINLFADECGNCFLDWPIDFVIKITDLETDKKYKYKFWLGDGPFIEFGIPKDGSGELILRGYDYNQYQNWVINFQNNEIGTSLGRTKEQIEEEFEFEKKLNKHFKIVEN